eukprot:GHVP01001822.1.p1 GENE.GHVP01001822.1~~GHVP01001822.1.p1  ORF type:complete len:101 (+),score=19.60 GHVP01001822.1:339-641(+)
MQENRLPAKRKQQSLDDLPSVRSPLPIPTRSPVHKIPSPNGGATLPNILAAAKKFLETKPVSKGDKWRAAWDLPLVELCVAPLNKGRLPFTKEDLDALLC